MLVVYGLLQVVTWDELCVWYILGCIRYSLCLAFAPCILALIRSTELPDCLIERKADKTREQFGETVTYLP